MATSGKQDVSPDMLQFANVKRLGEYSVIFLMKSHWQSVYYGRTFDRFDRSACSNMLKAWWKADFFEDYDREHLEYGKPKHSKIDLYNLFSLREFPDIEWGLDVNLTTDVQWILWVVLVLHLGPTPELHLTR